MNWSDENNTIEDTDGKRVTVCVNFEKRFSFFYDFDANQQLVGSQLTTALDVIFERITQDIFNESLAKW